jgi:hypothetical protein
VFCNLNWCFSIKSNKAKVTQSKSHLIHQAN